MKYLLITMIVSALVVASDDGYSEVARTVFPHSFDYDGVSLTLVNDWPQTQQVLGLDIYEYPGVCFVLGSDRNGMKIQSYNIMTGVPTGTITLSSGNTNCFGVACNYDPDTSTFLTNDWSDEVLYFTEDNGSSWTTFSNPSEHDARGMDFDGTDYWCTNGGGGGVWRFQPGVGQQNIATPQVTSAASGLTVFPYNGDIGLAVACYSSSFVEFYQWDGNDMVHLGSASLPISFEDSFGLAYAETNDHIFWSYKDASDIYHLAELSFEITSLERSSWGNIKSSF